MFNLDHVVPTLIRRECGGWMAISSKECALKIGVIGKTEADARSKFGDYFARWIETIKN